MRLLVSAICCASGRYVLSLLLTMLVLLDSPECAVFLGQIYLISDSLIVLRYSCVKIIAPESFCQTSGGNVLSSLIISLQFLE